MKRVEGAVELELEEKEETGVALPSVPHQLTLPGETSFLTNSSTLGPWYLKSKTVVTMVEGTKTFWEDQRAGGLKVKIYVTFAFFAFIRLEDQSQFKGPGLGPLSILLIASK